MPCICLFVRLLDCWIVTQSRHRVGIPKSGSVWGEGVLVGEGLVLEVRLPLAGKTLVRTSPDSAISRICRSGDKVFSPTTAARTQSESMHNNCQKCSLNIKCGLVLRMFN